MNFILNTTLATGYHSGSQISRVLTEDWVAKNLYCPICGESHIVHYENNKPVADFFCDKCASDFELKSKESKSGKLGEKINDGAYTTMIERITSLRNPNFFFMTYANNQVNNFVLVPNAYFIPELIEKRKPLAPTAKRAGWVGCIINISKIPENGKIYIVKNNQEVDHDSVILSYQQSKTQSIERKGWIMDVLSCIDKIDKKEFELKDVYDFAPSLQKRHPDNHNIEPKIRQQLQLLRDNGILDFLSPGHYRVR